MIKKALLITGFMTVAASASAADGCKFLLCMGAPNPLGISECAPTVKDVFRDLRKGKGLPSCKLASSNGSASNSSFVTARRMYEPECPEGYTRGKDGVYYVKGRPTNFNLVTGSVNHSFAGGGDVKDGWIARNRRNVDDDGFMKSKYRNIACVAGKKHHAINERLSDGSIRKYEFYENIKNVYEDPNRYKFVMHVDGKPLRTHYFSLNKF